MVLTSDNRFNQDSFDSLHQVVVRPLRVDCLEVKTNPRSTDRRLIRDSSRQANRRRCELLSTQLPVHLDWHTGSLRRLNLSTFQQELCEIKSTRGAEVY